MVLAFSTTPLLVVFLLLPQERAIGSSGLSNGLITYPVLLLTAALFYHYWYVSRDDVAAWLVLALSVVGVQGIALPALAERRLGGPVAADSWMAVLDLALGVVILIFAVACRSTRFRCDPLVLGLCLGFAMIGLRMGARYLAPEWDLTRAGLAALGAGVLLVYVALAAAVLLITQSPRWLRMRLAMIAALFGTSQAAMASGAVDTTTVGVVVLAVDIACAALLVTTAIRLLMSCFSTGDALAELHQLLESVEADVRVEKARIHEINATLAGITSAAELIHSQTSMSEHRRQGLEEMMQAELSRLTRLLQDPAPAHTVDLDDAIRHLVVAHEARGHAVHWLPTGTRATGCSDAVTEVISILLDNSIQHGSPHASIEVRADGETVEILVTDAGPGVSPDMRLRLFEWGEHRPGSQGQGFGLHIARQLAREQGGSLRLLETSSRGTTFVVGLPASADTNIRHDANQRSA